MNGVNNHSSVISTSVRLDKAGADVPGSSYFAGKEFNLKRGKFPDERSRNNVFQAIIVVELPSVSEQ